ncbi:MAG: thioredoxin fold domain-containing protein [Woeseiaceae bacterium]
MSPKLSFVSKLLAVALAVFIVDAARADDAELEAVRAKMSAMFEAIEPENVTASQVDGWYTIQQGSVVAYVSADGRYLLQGDLIDLEHQVNLTEQSRNGSRQGLVAELADDNAIVFTPSEVKHSVTVFTDIDCTYCRKLHSQIDEYLDQGIQVRYVLYPRNGPASAAWTKSEQVWCAEDRNQALTSAKLDRAFKSSQCDASVVSEHYGLGQDIGLSGTPAIVLQDGTLIAGYLPPAQLSMRLGAFAAD